MATEILKVKDRVRVRGVERCLGTVQDVRREVTGTSGDTKDKALMIKVQWDNGTLSYFDPSALEVVQG